MGRGGGGGPADETLLLFVFVLALLGLPCLAVSKDWSGNGTGDGIEGLSLLFGRLPVCVGWSAHVYTYIQPHTVSASHINPSTLETGWPSVQGRMNLQQMQVPRRKRYSTHRSLTDCMRLHTDFSLLLLPTELSCRWAGSEHSSSAPAACPPSLVHD